jgi:DNA helicase-2/ATP-dependent DNA helicase PcrA
VDQRFPTRAKGEPIELPAKLVKEIMPEGDFHLQEERRLMYVAMTRAKQGLFFTSASYYGGARAKKLSQFLIELSANGLKLSEAAVSAKKLETESPQIKPSPVVKTELTDSDSPSLKLRRSEEQKFSFTQLRAFENCPYQYRYAIILKIPVRGKPSLSYGKTMHLTLQRFFQQVLTAQNNSQSNLFGQSQSAEPDFEQLKKIYAEAFIRDWYPDKATLQKYYDAGLKSLKIFFDTWKKEPPLVKFLEYPFNLKITPEIWLKGSIDRVDETPDGLRLIDYKTGAGKSELKSEDKEQLLIYQLASETLLRQPVKELVFNYLEEGREVGFLGKEKELEKIKEKIIRVVEEIKQGDFPPKPGELCKFCDFNYICEYRK